MNKINKSAREAYKKIPSVDDLLKKYQLEVPTSFFKYYLNITLDEIRHDIINNVLNKDIKKNITLRIKDLIKKINQNSLKKVINRQKR